MNPTDTPQARADAMKAHPAGRYRHTIPRDPAGWAICATTWPRWRIVKIRRRHTGHRWIALPPGNHLAGLALFRTHNEATHHVARHLEGTTR